jgi:hypothetical protein
VHDKYPPIADVDTLVEKYRREGVNVTYRRFRFGGHVIVTFAGVRALRFLSERFVGRSRDAEPLGQRRTSEPEPRRDPEDAGCIAPALGEGPSSAAPSWRSGTR